MFYEKAERGVIDSHEYRIQACDPKTNSALSLWHNVPLFAVKEDGEPTGALNFICEIPKWCARNRHPRARACACEIPRWS